MASFHFQKNNRANSMWQRTRLPGQNYGPGEDLMGFGMPLTNEEYNDMSVQKALSNGLGGWTTVEVEVDEEEEIFEMVDVHPYFGPRMIDSYAPPDRPANSNSYLGAWHCMSSTEKNCALISVAKRNMKYKEQMAPRVHKDSSATKAIAGPSYVPKKYSVGAEVGAWYEKTPAQRYLSNKQNGQLGLYYHNDADIDQSVNIKPDSQPPVAKAPEPETHRQPPVAKDSPTMYTAADFGAIGELSLKEEEEDWWPNWQDGVELSVRLAMPSDVGKVPCCVIFVGGMPQLEYGSARMTDPLPTAILQNCWMTSLPTVRFDYTSYGNSTGEEVALDNFFAMRIMGKDFQNVLERVLSQYSQTVAVVAFSAGNASALPVLSQPNFKDKLVAYVSVNIGARSMAMSKPNPREELKIPPEKYLGEFADAVAALGHVPHLYIRADKDWMTPEKDVRYFMDLQAKATAGKNKVEYKVFPGKHAFEDLEAKPAEAIADFLTDVILLK